VGGCGGRLGNRRAESWEGQFVKCHIFSEYPTPKLGACQGPLARPNTRLPVAPGSVSAHPTLALVANVQGGITLGPGELAAEFCFGIAQRPKLRSPQHFTQKFSPVVANVMIVISVYGNSTS
jgi:hypothetical protein